jgi:hypothetical protein
VMSNPFHLDTVGPSVLARAVLNELLSKLRDLTENGRTANIDLKRLPLTTADRELLKTHLGRGEVNAKFDALGVSKITETRFSGIWWAIHKNAGGDVVGETIEIALIPEILATTLPQAVEAADTLAAELATLPAADT